MLLLLCGSLLSLGMPHVTRPACADSLGAPADSVVAPVLVSFDFGGGMSAAQPARAFEVALTGGGARRRTTMAASRLKLARVPDSTSVALARRIASGTHVPRIDVQLPGAGTAGLVLRLYDVQVVSTRLVASDDPTALLQQRLALAESMVQLTADREEAERQLEAMETLEKQHLSPSLDVARVRANAEVLSRRLAVQQQRLALADRQLARWTPVHEELELSASRSELATP
jgi:hypothetical protein